jgi:hypothetical protein
MVCRQANWREDFQRWKAFKGIPEDAKVFIVRGGYPFIRAALLRRGWHENPDLHSDFFDYKWTLKTKHIHSERLCSSQWVNHFGRSFSCLTTKVGLLSVRCRPSSFCQSLPLDAAAGQTLLSGSTPHSSNHH